MKRYTRRSMLALMATALLVPAMLPTAAGTKKTNKKRPPRQSWQQTERVMKDFNFRPGDVVADVGCGSGYFTFRISKAVGAEGKVLAMDISEKALKGLKSRLEKAKIENVVLTISDPKDIKVDERTADSAILVNVLHHAKKDQREPLAGSIAKALKPGGLLYIIDFKKTKKNPYHPEKMLVSREQSIELAKKAGLKLDAEWYYLELQYFLRFRKPTAEELKKEEPKKKEEAEKAEARP